MPVTNADNIKRWLEQSDIDYFTHFTKAWIPFNAWYRHAYDALEREREILEEIKTDGNRIRTRMMALLEGTDGESHELRNHIAQLHRRLSYDPLKDQWGREISFDQVDTGANPKMSANVSRFGILYTVSRGHNSGARKEVQSEVRGKSGNVIFTLTQAEWNEAELLAHADFKAKLGQVQRDALNGIYRDVNPRLIANLLAMPTETADFIDMDGYKFVSDRSAIFSGLVEILYSLRCLLFHGELVPDGTSNRTCEPAYHLVRRFIRCLV